MSVGLKRFECSPVAEVKIGASKNEGGTRDRVVTIGGDSAPPFTDFKNVKRRPALALTVVDYTIPMPKPVKDFLGDVIQDPAAWAKHYADRFNPDLINLYLASTDPRTLDLGPKDVVKTVEDVLHAVRTPLVFTGSGFPQKDGEVLVKVAEVTEGERCLLCSASMDEYRTITASALAYGHNVASFVPMDFNLAKQLNANILSMGLSRDRIVIDSATGALGYGLEHSYSLIERMRLSALEGDALLQMPILCVACNAWEAGESYRRRPEWGSVALRGPLWEAVTALAYIAAGVNLVIMLHPKTMLHIRRMLDTLYLDVRNPLTLQEYVG